MKAHKSAVPVPNPEENKDEVEEKPRHRMSIRINPSLYAKVNQFHDKIEKQNDALVNSIIKVKPTLARMVKEMPGVVMETEEDS